MRCDATFPDSTNEAALQGNLAFVRGKSGFFTREMWLFQGNLAHDRLEVEEFGGSDYAESMQEGRRVLNMLPNSDTITISKVASARVICTLVSISRVEVTSLCPQTLTETNLTEILN